MTTAVFKRIGLIGKSGDSNVATTLRALVRLLEAYGVEILLDADLADMLADCVHPVTDRDTLLQQALKDR